MYAYMYVCVLDDSRKLVCEPTGDVSYVLKQDVREIIHVHACVRMYTRLFADLQLTLEVC